MERHELAMIDAHHVRMASRFLTHRFRELHPFEVQALLLNACNLKCRYCRCPEIKSALLTTDQWRAVIRRFGQLGTVRIKFQGGEPTLRTDFAELCAETRRAGIICAVVTNGVRVAQEPRLLEGLDEIVLSVDSVSAEIHDRLRGAGTHALALQAMALAAQRGVRTFVVMVVHRENLSQMEALLRFCEERGVRLHAQPVLFGRPPFDDGARDLALTEEQVRAMHLQLAEWKRQRRGLMFSARTYAGVARWPDHQVLTTRSAGRSACMAGRYYVHIEANGDVLPCHQHGASLLPKNLVRDGIDEALRHAQRHDCGDCFTAYLNERKAVFGLKPAALLELIRRE